MVHAVLLKSSAGQLLWLYAVVCGAEVVCWAAGVAYAVRLTSSAGQLGLLYAVCRGVAVVCWTAGVAVCCGA